MFVVRGTRRHLCEQRVGGEGTVYLIVGKNWVSVRECQYYHNDVHSALGAWWRTATV